MNISQRISLALLATYKRFVSPAFAPSCRFLPTCSDYTAEAIARHGTVRGMMLGAGRVMRCNPLSKGGYDAVPVHENCMHSHRDGTATQEMKVQHIG